MQTADQIRNTRATPARSNGIPTPIALSPRLGSSRASLFEQKSQFKPNPSPRSRPQATPPRVRLAGCPPSPPKIRKVKMRKEVNPISALENPAPIQRWTGVSPTPAKIKCTNDPRKLFKTQESTRRPRILADEPKPLRAAPQPIAPSLSRRQKKSVIEPNPGPAIQNRQLRLSARPISAERNGVTLRSPAAMRKSKFNERTQEVVDNARRRSGYPSFSK
jgi:hypothetical protein